jgi:hypothetical protein
MTLKNPNKYYGARVIAGNKIEIQMLKKVILAFDVILNG